MVVYRFYICLGLGWIAFCLLHSFFAALPVKKIIARLSGKYFAYYRPLYSIASLVILFFLLQFQLEKKEPALFLVTSVLRTASIILILGGLIVMTISALRYFIPVTGVAIFAKQKACDQLLDRGIHGVIRHPLYAGTLLLIWGLFLFFPFVSNLIACIIISIYTFVGIRLEEKKLLLQFGQPYDFYRRRVPMMIPKLNLSKSKWQIKVDKIS